MSQLFLWNRRQTQPKSRQQYSPYVAASGEYLVDAFRDYIPTLVGTNTSQTVTTNGFRGWKFTGTGSNADYLQYAANGYLDDLFFTGPATFHVLCNVSSGTFALGLAGKGNDISGKGWFLGVNSSSGVISLTKPGSNTDGTVSTGSSAIPTGDTKFHLVSVVQYNNTFPIAASYFDIYVDGQKQTLSLNNAGVGSNASDAGVNFTLGNDGSFSRDFNGYIAFYAAIRRAQTQNEVQALWVNPNSIFTTIGDPLVKAPSSNTTVNASVGTVTLAGQAATVGVNINVSGAVGTVTLAGLAASVALTTAVNASVGTVSLTGLAAMIPINIGANTGTVTLAGQPSTVDFYGTVSWKGITASINHSAVGGIQIVGLPATVLPILGGGTPILPGIPGTDTVPPAYFQDGNTHTPITASWLNGVNNGVYNMINQVTALTYTVGTVDYQALTAVNTPTASLVTIGPSSSVAFPLNTVLKFLQEGAGQITLTGGPGVTLVGVNNQLSTKGQYGVIYAQQTQRMDTWIVWGDTAATLTTFTNPGPVIPVNPPPPPVGPNLNITSSGSSVNMVGLGASVNPVVNVPPAPITPVADGNTLTTITFVNTSGVPITNVPVTFGQVFPVGAMAKTTAAVALQYADLSTVTTQINVLATHADGSVRHAVISAVLPSLAASQTKIANIQKITYSAPATGPAPSTFINAGLESIVSLTDISNGTTYTAKLSDNFTSGYLTQFNGAIASEWNSVAPLKAAGVAHPHLQARFYIRAYSSLNQAEIDVVVENASAYDAYVTVNYNLSVSVAGTTVFTQNGVAHGGKTAWKKTFWWGTQPTIHVRHNTAYMISSQAVPNYDQTVVPSASRINQYLSTLNAHNGLLQEGNALPAMATTGGRPDIGLLPGWDTLYLLDQGPTSKAVMLGQADLARGWNLCYRDPATDFPISLQNYPYATISGNQGDSWNPTAKRYEKLPDPPTQPRLAYEENHHPDMYYMAYLVTGKYFYLETLHFNASLVAVYTNPGYRNYAYGWIDTYNVRGQAWGMRDYGRAGYITPDAHPSKAYYVQLTNNILERYRLLYVDNVSANNLHYNNSNARDYPNAIGQYTGIAPWQDDFFTSSAGHLAELGYQEAVRLVAWKALFPILRLTSGNEFCWILASAYNLFTSDTGPSALYTTIGQMYQASFDSSVTVQACNSAGMLAAYNTKYNTTLKTSEMVGYSSSNTGFPSNMQPAVAMAANSTFGISGGSDAWLVFNNRSVKPDYTQDAQFAIVPR